MKRFRIWLISWDIFFHVGHIFISNISMLRDYSISVHKQPMHSKNTSVRKTRINEDPQLAQWEGLKRHTLPAEIRTLQDFLKGSSCSRTGCSRSDGRPSLSVVADSLVLLFTVRRRCLPPTVVALVPATPVPMTTSESLALLAPSVVPTSLPSAAPWATEAAPLANV